MLKLKLLIALAVLGGKSYAAGYPAAAGAEALSTGNCALKGRNAFSSFNNPAMMAGLKKKQFGLSATNRFGLADVNQLHMAFAMPYKHFGFGASVMQYGNGAYNEQSFGLSAAHALTEKFSFGVGTQLNTLAIAGYGHTTTVHSLLSLFAKVNSQLQIAFRAMNPERTRIKKGNDERLATVWQMAGIYQAGKQVSITGEVEKNNALPANLKAGFDYTPADKIHLRMGFSSLQPCFTFGAGFRYKKIIFEAASQIHQVLGVTSNFSIQLEIGR